MFLLVSYWLSFLIHVIVYKYGWPCILKWMIVIQIMIIIIILMEFFLSF
jgi:hypothetical protein